MKQQLKRKNHLISMIYNKKNSLLPRNWLVNKRLLFLKVFWLLKSLLTTDRTKRLFFKGAIAEIQSVWSFIASVWDEENIARVAIVRDVKIAIRVPKEWGKWIQYRLRGIRGLSLELKIFLCSMPTLSLEDATARKVTVRRITVSATQKDSNAEQCVDVWVVWTH